MNIVLTPAGPLDARGTMARYHMWGEDPANRVDGDVFRRVLRVKERLVPYAVRWQGGVDDARLSIDVPDERAAAVGEAAAFETRRIFGLDFDLPGFYRLAKSDPAL